MQITKETWEKNALLAIQNNPVLAKLYTENAKVGSEDLVTSLPLLKIHSVGRSLDNVLEDGSEPENGNYFYQPTNEEFKEIECHILTVSRGYYAKGYKGGKNIYNQILAGIIVNEGRFQPFIFYVSGKKLRPMWDFTNSVSMYTRAKPIPVPLFALRIKMTTEQVLTEDKIKVWIPKFDVMKDENGMVLVISDEQIFMRLRENVEMIRNKIAIIIAKQEYRPENETPSAPIPEDPIDQF